MFPPLVFPPLSHPLPPFPGDPMAARRSIPKYLTKPGQYGTLYRWAIPYEEGIWHCWAYSVEHAEDKFLDDNEGDYRMTGAPRKVKAP